MIRRFRLEGLARFFGDDDRRRIRSEHADKIGRILARLDAASQVGDMDLPGFRLHPLKGDLRGYWSVAVSGNWRIIFRFQGGHASDVDLVDYH